MKHLFLKTAILLFAITFLKCENNDPQEQLPPITQTGANTFSCIINGEILIPKDAKGNLGGPGGPRKGLSVYYFQNKNFEIDAGNFRDVGGDNIYININNLNSIGTYNFGLSSVQPASTFKPDYPYCWAGITDNLDNEKRYLSNTNSGTITITRLDNVNKIISGNFELTVFNNNDPNEIIRITEGRFDINLNTVNK
jgi:hypothetical protein